MNSKGMIILLLMTVLILPLSVHAQPPENPPPAGPIDALREQLSNDAEGCPCWKKEYLDEYAYTLAQPICDDNTGDGIQLRSGDGMSFYLSVINNANLPFILCVHTDLLNEIDIPLQYITPAEGNACGEILRNSQMWALNCTE
jgi:hypothetical protein